MIQLYSYLYYSIQLENIVNFKQNSFNSCFKSRNYRILFFLKGYCRYGFVFVFFLLMKDVSNIANNKFYF